MEKEKRRVTREEMTAYELRTGFKGLGDFFAERGIIEIIENAGDYPPFAEVPPFPTISKSDRIPGKRKVKREMMAEYERRTGFYGIGKFFEEKGIIELVD